MKKFNLKKIMTHAWNIVRKAARNGKKVYIAAAMKSAWADAKEAAKEIFICGLDVVRSTDKAICVKLDKECCTTGYVSAASIWLPKSLLQIIASKTECMTRYYAPYWLLAKKIEEYICEHCNFSSNYIFKLGNFTY